MKRLRILSVLAFIYLVTFLACIGCGAIFVLPAILPLGSWKLKDTPPPRATVLDETESPKPYANCGEPNPHTPLVPGRVVDSWAYRDCGADGFVDEHFVALDDGTIWEWDNYQGGIGFFSTLLFYAIFATAFGAVVSILMLGIRLGWKRWHRLHTLT